MNILTRYTIENLKQNRARTIVTVVGIILSMAMFIAVSVLVSSSQAYLINSVKAGYGNWYGIILSADDDAAQHMENNEDIENIFALHTVGYAHAEDIVNPFKPYIYVAAADSGFFENMPVNVTSGRLPENSGEIIIPEHLYYNGGVTTQLNQQITLQTGMRINRNGHQLYQHSQLDGEYPERLEITGEHTYTIVGFYRRPSFEDWSAPGYTAITYSETAMGFGSDIYYIPENPAKTFEIMDIYTSRPFNCESITNTSLLRFSGNSMEDSYNRVLYGLGRILVAIIVFASIALIYNAFSISVSERVKQFGLLSSIGATKKQLRSSVITEALILCCFGIPLGIVSGMGGIAVTLQLTQKIFRLGFKEMSLYGAHDVGFAMKITPLSVMAAVVLAVGTVLVSAYIPAYKSAKVSAIDAIRQAKDIRISRKVIRTNPLAYRLFGFEAVMAARNFRRSRKRYRATIISLFMSVVLFISAYSFCDSLKRGVTNVLENVDYDIMYSYNNSRGDLPDVYRQYRAMRNVAGVTRSGYYVTLKGVDIITDSNNVVRTENTRGVSFQKTAVSTTLLFVDDENYSAWLRDSGYNPADYVGTEIPLAFTTNTYQYYDEVNERYVDFTMLKNTQTDVNIDAGGCETIRLAGTCTTMPYGLMEYGKSMPLILPFSAMDKVLGNSADGLKKYVNMVFSSSDASLTELKMAEMLGRHQYYVYNFRHEYDTNRAIIGIVNVFTYGFIVLISLIATANVFNTISTNITLRKREFAILRSVGMADSGFDRMMIYECLMYGIKSLLYGLPVALAVSLQIHRVIGYGYSTDYHLPAAGIAIAVFSVFIVVFVTMIYATGKVKKENTIDVLKNENI